MTSTQENTIEQVSLRRALEEARELNEPGEGDVNPEYVRGQANLIVNLFALYYSDGTGNECHELVTDAVTHRITVNAALSELAALTGAEV